MKISSGVDTQELLAVLGKGGYLSVGGAPLKEILTRLEQAEAQVARVREVIHQYDPEYLTCMCNSDGDCCKCTVADFQEALDGEPNE